MGGTKLLLPSLAPVAPVPRISWYGTERVRCLCITGCGCFRRTHWLAYSDRVDASEDKAEINKSCNNGRKACEGKDVDLPSSAFTYTAL